MKTLNDFYEKYKNNIHFQKIDIITENDSTEITHMYWVDLDNFLAYCLVAPHSGNHYKFMLRVNPIKTLDRWSVADIEEFYDTIDNVDYVINDNKWIYKCIARYYVENYIDAIKDDEE